MTTLSATRVRELVTECLPNPNPEISEDEIKNDPHNLLVEGIMATYAFDREKIAAARPEIEGMALCLDDEFFMGEGGGGGWSFLQMALDRDGVHWAEHPTMEMLCALMIGAGIAQWALPRELWSALPGGMPYITIHSKAEFGQAADV